jgi:DNA-binding transcriptional LysR family regulator
MNTVQLRRLDLNLLVVFDAIYRERSIAATSLRLKLSQSAISHALGRLRRALGDELFIRDAGGMRPTDRAMELAAPIQSALTRIETALASEDFHPQRSSRTFVLAASDFACATLTPLLIERLVSAAPGIDVSIIPANRGDWVRLLDEGRIDLAIAWFAVVPERFGRSSLLEDDYVFVVRQGHALVGAAATTEDVLRFRQVIVNYLGNEDGVVDGFLPDRGLTRRVHMERVALEAVQRLGRGARIGARVPHAWCVPQILARTDFVASLPRRVALQFRDLFGLAVVEPAEVASPIACEVIWNRSAESDAGLQWLRKQLEGAARAVPTRAGRSGGR